MSHAATDSQLAITYKNIVTDIASGGILYMMAIYFQHVGFFTGNFLTSVVTQVQSNYVLTLIAVIPVGIVFSAFALSILSFPVFLLERCLVFMIRNSVVFAYVFFPLPSRTIRHIDLDGQSALKLTTNQICEKLNSSYEEVHNHSQTKDSGIIHLEAVYILLRNTLLACTICTIVTAFMLPKNETEFVSLCCLTALCLYSTLNVLLIGRSRCLLIGAPHNINTANTST